MGVLMSVIGLRCAAENKILVNKYWILLFILSFLEKYKG